MATTPDQAFVRQYQNTIVLLAQQMDSRIRQTVMVDTNWSGEMKLYDQYGTDSMTELSTRYQDTPIQNPSHYRRSVAPRYFVSSTLEDPVDALQMVLDPKSAYMQAKMASGNRQMDDIVIAKYVATALTGKSGTDSTSFTAANQIASASTGMTKTKMLKAKRLLDAAEVEKEDRFLVLSAYQLQDLLATTEVTSSDYNTVKALVQGEVDTWIGFKLVHTERLLTNGSSERLCYAYNRKAMQLAIQKEPVGRIDERPDKNFAWQVYMKLCMGSTRLEESRICEIACTEA